MRRLNVEQRRSILALLVEGVGVNAAARLSGISKPSVLKVLREAGCACAKLHDDRVKSLKPKRIECDEVWAFVHCKQKHVAGAKAAPEGAGDCWTWTAIDADSKLVISYLIGLRSHENAAALMLDLASRVNCLTQLTTDGLVSYPNAVLEAFGTDIDYAQLIKVYNTERPDHARYSPADCVGCRKQHVIGCPDPARISTSIVERSNLTIRMQNRRYTRLTNGHSKKVENHGHATALFMAYYNFCRKHQSLGGKTPAQAAGLADDAWTLSDLAALGM